MNSESAPVAVARQMRTALNRAGDALVNARLDGMLDAERMLAAAVAMWPQAMPAGLDRGELRREMQGIRPALERCRRLGLALSAFANASCSATGLGRGYDRTGVAQARAIPQVRAAWEARV